MRAWTEHGKHQIPFLQDYHDGLACFQGDQEKAKGLLVSPLMDREQAGGMVRSQVMSSDAL